jgi:hypothetical protein
MNQNAGPAPHMHTTTVRFDDDEWQDLSRECRRLRIAKAQYIRSATRDRIAGGQYRGAVQQLHVRVVRLEQDRRP